MLEATHTTGPVTRAIRAMRTPVLHLATVEGEPVNQKRKKPTKSSSPYNRRRGAIQQAETLVAQSERVERILDALYQAAKRDDLIVVHALWRDLSVESKCMTQCGRNILDFLD